ncbi:MAG: hypothetical protein Kow0047_15910 [Anaerolineae bacterium]
MADYLITGQLVAENEFTPVLRELEQEAQQAQDSLSRIDDSIDSQSARSKIEQINQAIDELHQKAAAGKNIKAADIERLRDLADWLSAQRAGLDEIEQGAQRARGSFSELLGAVRRAQAAMLGFFGAFATSKLIAFTMELVRAGAQAQMVGRIFQNVARQAGIAGDQLIAEMSRAAEGTIDQTRLMIIANRALMAGGAELADKLPKLLEIARAASLATGQDINFVFDTLVRGIVKASPLLIDNADIYIRIGDAVEEWAEKQGKAVDRLTETERRVAIANAVIEQGTRFIQQFGLDGETAADQLQSLPAAIEDVKSALGELALQIGVVQVLEDLADALRVLAGTDELTQAIRQMDRLIKELEELGGQGAAVYFLNQVYDIYLSRLPDDQKADALRALNVEIERAMTNFQAAGGGMADFGTAEEEAAEKAARAREELEAFNRALREAQMAASSVDALQTKLGQLAAQLDAMAAGLPRMPEIGAALGEIDTGALRAYLAELARVRPEMQSAVEATLRHVDAVEAAQRELIRHAESARTAGGALHYLASETMGASNSALDLIRNYDRLSPVLQSAVDHIADAATMLSLLRREAERPIAPDVRLQELESGMRQIDSMMLRLAGILPADRIREMWSRALTEYQAYFQSQGEVTEFEMRLFQAQFMQRWDEVVQGIRDKYNQMRKAAEQGAKGFFESAGQLSSAIQSALRAGVEVAPEDMLATQAGTYQDKALEAARRLEAIAQRGFAEIEAHPDWVALLKIPPDVLSGSEEQLKAWAARTKQDVMDLARPDLINWDAFIENFRQLQEREAARELTIDIAVEKLQAAGIDLTGTTEEDLKRQVAETLGLAMPSLSIEALFQAKEGAAADLINQITGGTGALSVPVSLQMPEGDAQAWLVGLGLGGPAGGVTIPTDMTDEQAAASQAGQAVISAFQAALQGFDPATVVGSWSERILSVQEQLRTAGGQLGAAVAEAFRTAVVEDVGDIRSSLAALIAPEVAEVLSRQGRGTRELQ